jgi:hypothetical protein
LPSGTVNLAVALVNSISCALPFGTIVFCALIEKAQMLKKSVVAKIVNLDFILLNF